MHTPALQALIFDVDGTLADTEEAHRAAFNHAFAELGMDWHWDESLYTRLLDISGGKERIRHYWNQAYPHPRVGRPFRAGHHQPDPRTQDGGL